MQPSLPCTLILASSLLFSACFNSNEDKNRHQDPAHEQGGASDEDSDLRIESPSLQITLLEGSNVIAWQAIQGAASYSLYYSKKENLEFSKFTNVKDVQSPYTHIKSEDRPHFYSMIAKAEPGLLDSRPAAIVSDKPQGFLAECLGYKADARRTMDAALLSSAIKSCYELAKLGPENITELDLREKELSDLSPLTHFTGLQALNLAANRISDLSPLAALTGITQLNLSANEVLIDLLPIAGLVHMESLNIASNAITDISPLADMREIRSFLAEANNITDVVILGGFSHLETLDLSLNQIVRSEQQCPVVNVPTILAEYCLIDLEITYEDHISKLLLVHNCLSCHGDLFPDEASLIAIAELANEEIQLGLMPPSGDLSATDKLIFSRWVSNLPVE